MWMPSQLRAAARVAAEALRGDRRLLSGQQLLGSAWGTTQDGPVRSPSAVLEIVLAIIARRERERPCNGCAREASFWDIGRDPP